MPWRVTSPMYERLRFVLDAEWSARWRLGIALGVPTHATPEIAGER
jgi:hypothetical protein